MLKSGIFILLGIMFYSSVNAQMKSDKFYFGVSAGEIVPIGDFSDFNRPETTLGLEAGYKINDNFTAIAEFGYTSLEGKIRTSEYDTPLSRMMQLSAGIKLGINIIEKLHLYSKIARGIYFIDRYNLREKEDKYTSNYGGYIGVGGDYNIGKDVFLFLESKVQNVSHDEPITFLTFQGGTRINF